MKLALDVSAVPPRMAGAGRYIGELARRVPATGIDTTLVTRRDDAPRWHDWSTERARRRRSSPTRGRRDCSTRPSSPVGVRPLDRSTSGTRRTTRCRAIARTPTVVTILDLMFFTNPEWHERSQGAVLSTRHLLRGDARRRARGHQRVHRAPVGRTRARTRAGGGGDPRRRSREVHDRRERRRRTLARATDSTVDRPYIFYLGTFEPRKGIDVLLDAFEEIARRDSDVELWLAGQPGWGVKEIEARIANHDARSRIRRLGFVDETVLPALLRQSRVVSYPSRGEGFGMPVIEALACGAVVETSAGHRDVRDRRRRRTAGSRR